MSTVGQAFDNALGELRTRYLARLKDTVAELSKLIAFCEMDALTPEIAEAARLQAHKLTGSGHTLGFPKVSEEAAVLEEALAPAAPDTAAVAKAASALAATCRSHIEAGAVASAAPAAQTPAPESAPELPPMAGPSIIAIHDDAVVGRLLDDVFASHAHIVRFASIAETHMPPHPAGLIIVDLDSPGSQTTMLGALRTKPGFRDTPVLALTAQRKSAAVARAILGTQLEALLKPVTPIELDAKASAALQRRKLSVVIGDDDRIVRELLKARFESQGYAVHLAHDGEDVIALARDKTPSIIILDREMPKIEGLKVLFMLKADPLTHDIPVIMLTSKGQAHEIAEGRKAGAADYMVKPFAPDQVLARASQILGLPG